MYTVQDVAGALDAAAQYIEEHGWIQDKLRDENGAVCALGAIGEVTPNPFTEVDTFKIPYSDTLREKTVRTLDRRIRETSRFGGVARWNDYRGRKSPEKILREMRKLANELRAGSYSPYSL